jgi:hypothetical protein
MFLLGPAVGPVNFSSKNQFFPVLLVNRRLDFKTDEVSYCQLITGVHLVVDRQEMQKQNKLLNAGPQFLSNPTYVFFFRVNPASLSWYRALQRRNKWPNP